tara:strand:+ start:711 stop:932 length:222 start_codon:yes stop_codon:yes gene_type:complete
MFQTFRYLGGHFVAIECRTHLKIVGSNGEYYGAFKTVKQFKRDGKLPPVLCRTRLITELIEEIPSENGLSNDG